ncbi:MAG TPA: Calx-beta domain-containing protein [Pyrinomonadaceae bacterium]|nr:Calx-beta domain-containing protein [Pyrinomonadaceae bacterium]
MPRTSQTPRAARTTPKARPRGRLKSLAALASLCALLSLAVVSGNRSVAPARAQAQPVLSVKSASVQEGDSGQTNALVTVELLPASSQTVTVNFKTNEMTALSGVDYQHVAGSLSFSPGATERTVVVPINGDTTDEENEHLWVSLSNAVGAGISVSSNPPLLTILDDDATPRNVTLSQLSYTFDEPSGLASITVNRTGDLSVTSSVEYETRNSAANDRTDYLAAYGTLVFTPGEGNKTINIFLTDDRYDEGQGETFTILLTRPTNTALNGFIGPDASADATVIIRDDETAHGTNPVRAATFNPEFFVRQHYRDFFNREADAAGLAFWMGQTTNCGNADLQVCRDNVSAAFFVSTEFQQTGFVVYLAHEAAYNTGERLQIRNFLPDQQRISSGVIVGEAGWEAKLAANKQTFFESFVAGEQFRFFFPDTLTPAEVVDRLNTNAGGVLSASEREALVAELSANNTVQGRAAVLRRVVEDSDFVARERSRAFVLTQYFGYMRRNPNDAPEWTLDFQGYDFWLGKLNDHGGNYITAQMVQAFITSGEYEARFAP